MRISCFWSKFYNKSLLLSDVARMIITVFPLRFWNSSKNLLYVAHLRIIYQISPSCTDYTYPEIFAIAKVILSPAVDITLEINRDLNINNKLKMTAPIREGVYVVRLFQIRIFS